jgi:hypothetical protein
MTFVARSICWLVVCRAHRSREPVSSWGRTMSAISSRKHSASLRNANRERSSWRTCAGFWQGNSTLIGKTSEKDLRRLGPATGLSGSSSMQVTSVFLSSAQEPFSSPSETISQNTSSGLVTPIARHPRPLVRFWRRRWRAADGLAPRPGHGRRLTSHRLSSAARRNTVVLISAQPRRASAGQNSESTGQWSQLNRLYQAGETGRPASPSAWRRCFKASPRTGRSAALRQRSIGRLGMHFRLQWQPPLVGQLDAASRPTRPGIRRSPFSARLPD